MNLRASTTTTFSVRNSVFFAMFIVFGIPSARAAFLFGAAFNPLIRTGVQELSLSYARAEVGPRCTTATHGAGFCTTAAVCAPWFHVVTQSPDFKCKLPGGEDGYCCPENDSGSARNGLETRANVELRTPILRAVGDEDLKWASDVALNELRELDAKEADWARRGLVVRHGSSSSFHGAFFISSNETNRQGRMAYTHIAAARALAQRFNLTRLEAGWGLRQFSARSTSLGQTCPQDAVSCPANNFYRTIDGTCNNLRNLALGKSRSPFGRLMPPAYEDGIWMPRQHSVTGALLPPARKASSKMEPDRDRPMSGVTLFTMLFGQFIDHDLTLGALFKTKEGKSLPCCDENGKILQELDSHPACFPIHVKDDDSFYTHYKVECMNFVRAMPSPKAGCTLGHATQMNQLTHWVDASMVYGSTREEESRLRGNGGKMRVTVVQGHTEPLLPLNKFGIEDECTDPAKNQYCFIAGDPRSNEQIVLAVMHTIFVREHNRIVDELKRLNPHWDDERLYQETRRIIIAMVQHVTYNEWLPLILGSTKMLERGLTPLTSGFRYDYDDSVDPASVSEFVIAFRFGHTLLQGHYDVYDENYRVITAIQLRSTFNNALQLYTNGYFDGLVRGLTIQNSQSFDNSFTEDVQHHLFAKGHPFGMDLVALNVQRGRDHAVRPYNDYREFCGMRRAKTFDDLLDTMLPSEVESLKRVYAHVDDIDLFIGGVCELSAPGAVLGPTFQCIVGEQFSRVKKADRYFYDLGNQPHSFTPQQLAEIRKVTMSRIVCDNVASLRRVQPLIFYEASSVNPVVSCDSPQIPRMVLSNGWRDPTGTGRWTK